MRFWQAHNIRPQNLQIRQSRSQSHGFFQSRLGGPALPVAGDIGMQDPGAGHMRFVFFQELSSPSYKLIGCAGIIVEIACL